MSGGWTVVDAITNKSMPITGTTNSGAITPYVTPAPGTQDPVGKMRVSTPQSLIDTDFEYGTQPTKWESIALQNQRPSAYYIPQQPLAVTSLLGLSAGNYTLTLTVASSITIADNTAIYIQNSSNATINGWAWIVTGGTGTTFTVTIAPSASVSIVASTEYFNAGYTYIYSGYFYQNCSIPLAVNGITVASAVSTLVTTLYPHGLNVGSYIYLNPAALTGAPAGLSGAYIVSTVNTPTTFQMTTVGVTVSSPTNASGLTGVLFARPAGYVEPRSFDGGVAFSAGGAVPNQQLIRQTRRYFRYQSGKGIQFSTGSSFKPPLFVTGIVNVGNSTTFSIMQITTRYQHNIAVGATILVQGCTQPWFNGTFTVTAVTPNTIRYNITPNNPATPFSSATGNFRVTPLSWYGSNSRLGFFDQQNGLFFNFNGQTLSAVQRNSTNQISGSISVTQGSAIVTGTSTTFTGQLIAGQFIVIRGQTYRILSIASDTSMFIAPEYRGTTISNVICSVTQDIVYPQSQWNLDKCDGTGPSGYNIDLTRMQMWYIDYSWYGAGYIRWGVRGPNGLIIYVHQQQNNNKQFEAYMRSGNMSAHYEVNGLAPATIQLASLSNAQTNSSSAPITASQTVIYSGSPSNSPVGTIAQLGNNSPPEYVYVTSIDGTASTITVIRGFLGSPQRTYGSFAAIIPSSISLLDSTGFPPTGQVVCSNGTSTELIGYAGIYGNILYGLTRGQLGGSFGISYNGGTSYLNTVALSSPDSVPSLSHWGSSAIMDGQFNDDKSLIFNYGTPKLTTTTSITQVTPILAIRIAPSVDNGQIGTLGVREIINRMQLQLVELGIYATGPLLVNLVLNGYVSAGYSGTFVSPVTQGVGAYTSSLAQIAANNVNSVTLVGGESVAAAFTNSNGQTTLDLSQVRDLGNSILGGGINNTVPTSQTGVYPDGPDILYVCVTPLGATATDVFARLSWKEAQA
jgi:hypothetical protein